MTKQEILSQALAAREQEHLGYQINIDNYRLAIQKIAAAPYSDPKLAAAMQAYASQLQELLDSSLIEQAKSAVIRDVIKEQLEA